MSESNTSLRLRPWASLLLFVSAYAPLLLILVIKDLDPSGHSLIPRHPLPSLMLILTAIVSSMAVLSAVANVGSGLVVEVTKAANKSGEMFGYTIPYMLSFLRIDLGDWQVIASLLIFLAMLFVVSYRTQTVFVNPILALRGYMLIDCTFKRGNTETQALVLTRAPISVGERRTLEQMSHYLYIAAQPDSDS